MKNAFFYCTKKPRPFQEKGWGAESKIFRLFLCILPPEQLRLLAQELAADDPADLTGAHHLAHLVHACPLDAVGLARQQDDLGQRRLALQAVEVEMGVAVPVGADVLELLLPCPDAGLLEEFPGDGDPAGLARLGGAAGIFPGAGKALALRPAGQQDVAPAVIDPHADHQTVLPRTPPGPPAMEPPGQIAAFVVNIIPFQAFHPLYTIIQVSIPQLEQKGNRGFWIGDTILNCSLGYRF